MNRRIVVSASVVGMLPVVATAEVSDKIVAIPHLWLEGALVGAIGFMFARYRPWWSVLVVAFSGIMLAGVADLYADPYMAEAIWHEQGLPYVVSAWASASLPFVAVIAGLALRNLSAQRS